jgi:hypothetical protein
MKNQETAVLTLNVIEETAEGTNSATMKGLVKLVDRQHR